MKNSTFSNVGTKKFWDHRWALSLTSALFLSLSFPPFNLSILQIPAFVFLVRLSLLCDSKRQVIYYAYPSFILWNLLSTYWLMMATIAGGIAAILANAVIMLLPLLLIRSFFRSGLHPLLSSLFGASAWAGYEFLHHNWDLSWPWLTLGNGWSNHIGAIQYISVTGVFGISFWVVLSSLFLFSYFQKPSKRVLASAAFVFLVFPVLSAISLSQIPQDQGDPVDVAIVQPNSDSYQRFGGLSSLDELLDKLLDLSKKALTDNTDVIIWPENAVDTSLMLNSPHLSRIRDSLKVWNTSLITGSGLIEFHEEDGQQPQVTRLTADGRKYNVYNAALYLKTGKQTEVYNKGKLVPIVERFPFVNFFQMADLFEWVDWGKNVGYGLGTEATLFDVDGSLTPALICYDSVFSGWVNQFVQNGAGFLTIITNDGWWGDSHGHIQHFAFARLRAIEHRMWIARSANNGISGIISPDGNVQLETEYWTETAFPFTIYSHESRTFYSKHGNWIGYLSVFLAIFGIGLVYFKRN